MFGFEDAEDGRLKDVFQDSGLEKANLPYFTPNLEKYPMFATLQNYQKQGIAFLWIRENPSLSVSKFPKRFTTVTPAQDRTFVNMDGGK